MKNNFAKKTTKILTAAILSAFVLVLFNIETVKAESSSSQSSESGFTYTLLQPLPKEGTDLSENVTLEEYLTWAFRFILVLTGFLAVMMIVIGGVEYIISGANEAMRGEAKKRIENAIWGLVMALVSYLVLYTINPSLVDFNNNQFFKDCDKETTTQTQPLPTNSGNMQTPILQPAPVLPVPPPTISPTIPTGGTS